MADYEIRRGSGVKTVQGNTESSRLLFLEAETLGDIITIRGADDAYEHRSLHRVQYGAGDAAAGRLSVAVAEGGCWL